MALFTRTPEQLAIIERSKNVFEMNKDLLLWNIIPCEETYKAFVKTRVVAPSVIDDIKKTSGQNHKNRLILDDALAHGMKVEEFSDALSMSGHNWLADHLKTEFMKRDSMLDKDDILREFPHLQQVLPSKRDREKLYRYIIEKFKATVASKGWIDRPLDQLLDKEKLIATKQKHMEDTMKFREMLGGQDKRISVMLLNLDEAVTNVEVKGEELKAVNNYVTELKEYYDNMVDTQKKANEASDKHMARQQKRLEEHIKMMEELSMKVNLNYTLPIDEKQDDFADVLLDDFDKHYNDANKAIHSLLPYISDLEKKKSELEKLKDDVNLALRALQKPVETNIYDAVRDAIRTRAAEKASFDFHIDGLMKEFEALEATNRILAEKAAVFDQNINVGKLNAMIETKTKRILDLEREVQRLKLDLKYCQEQLSTSRTEVSNLKNAFSMNAGGQREQYETRTPTAPAKIIQFSGLRENVGAQSRRSTVGRGYGRPSQVSKSNFPSRGQVYPNIMDSQTSPLPTGGNSYMEADEFRRTNSPGRTNAQAYYQRQSMSRSPARGSPQPRYASPGQMRAQQRILGAGQRSGSLVPNHLPDLNGNMPNGQNRPSYMMLSDTPPPPPTPNYLPENERQELPPSYQPYGQRRSYQAQGMNYGHEMDNRRNTTPANEQKTYSPGRRFFSQAAKTGRRTTTVSAQKATGSPAYTIPGLKEDKSLELEKELDRTRGRILEEQKMFARRRSSGAHSHETEQYSTNNNRKADQHGILLGKLPIPDPLSYSYAAHTNSVNALELEEAKIEASNVDSFYKLLPGGVQSTDQFQVAPD